MGDPVHSKLKVPAGALCEDDCVVFSCSFQELCKAQRGGLGSQVASTGSASDQDQSKEATEGDCHTCNKTPAKLERCSKIYIAHSVIEYAGCEYRTLNFQPLGLAPACGGKWHASIPRALP